MRKEFKDILGTMYDTMQVEFRFRRNHKTCKWRACMEVKLATGEAKPAVPVKIGPDGNRNHTVERSGTLAGNFNALVLQYNLIHTFRGEKIKNVLRQHRTRRK